jgi:glycerate 2-kinase
MLVRLAYLSYIFVVRRFPRVLLAPDKFKGTLVASEVAAALAAGLERVCPDVALRIVPVADGGEGSVDVALASGYLPQRVRALDARGDVCTTTFARSGDRGVVELASICGLTASKATGVDPEAATSAGIGVALGAAIDLGCKDLTLALGGSASTDGGIGILTALGARLLDAAGHELRNPVPDLMQARSVDLSGLDPRLAATRIRFAVDVDAPLLGTSGAAVMFGPQKGAAPDAVARLEAKLSHWARLLTQAAPISSAAMPGAGAAGGVGFVGPCIGASLVNGAAAFLDLAGIDDAISDADLVVTGEGRLDPQTLMGKAPAAVAARCQAQQTDCVAVVGRRDNRMTDALLAKHGFAATYALVGHDAHTPTAEQSRAALAVVGAQLASERLQSSQMNHQITQGAGQWR